MELTTRVDPRHSHIEPIELGSQQPHQMIRCGFACGVTGHVNIRGIVHTGTRTRDDDSTPALTTAPATVSQVELRGPSQKG